MSQDEFDNKVLVMNELQDEAEEGDDEEYEYEDGEEYEDGDEDGEEYEDLSLIHI